MALALGEGWKGHKSRMDTLAAWCQSTFRWTSWGSSSEPNRNCPGLAQGQGTHWEAVGPGDGAPPGRFMSRDCSGGRSSPMGEMTSREKRPLHPAACSFKCREEVWGSVGRALDHIFLCCPSGTCHGVVLPDPLWLVGTLCVILANGFRPGMTCASLEHLC